MQTVVIKLLRFIIAEVWQLQDLAAEDAVGVDIF